MLGNSSRKGSILFVTILIKKVINDRPLGMLISIISIIVNIPNNFYTWRSFSFMTMSVASSGLESIEDQKLIYVAGACFFIPIILLILATDYSRFNRHNKLIRVRGYPNGTTSNRIRLIHGHLA